MVAIAIENMIDCKEELIPLFEKHWEEVALYKELTMSPNWEMYETFEETGQLFFVTAREDDELVGYAVWILCPSLHYSNNLIASNDLIFLKEEYRHTKDATNLLAFSEAELKKKGADILTLHMKTYAPFETLATGCNFDKQEYLYTKLIG